MHQEKMTHIQNIDLRSLPEEIHKRKRIILGELKERTMWFVQLRWLVPPGIVAGTVVGRLIGVEFSAGPLLLVAAFILVYNIFFAIWGRSLMQSSGEQIDYIQRFTYYQVALDYTAMFLLIHFTGGASSPLIFFFIFHIIFASILLRPRSAYGFAVLAAAGMAAIAFGEYFGWISNHSLTYGGKNINLIRLPLHMMIFSAFFATTVFTTAISTTAIMSMLRKRIVNLAELSEELTSVNNKLKSLYVVTQAIVSNQHLDQVLNIAASELAAVMNVQGLSVKLLSEDDKFLQYAVVYGLPPELTKDKVIEVAKSPLNRKVIEGEPFVAGHVTRQEMFQFGEDLLAAKMQSVLFVPLIVEERVTGILGAYSKRPEEFGTDEVDFFRLAAGLLAIALENARYYEEIEEMVKERSRFMMRVAHNLRAPLAATISILDVVQGKYLGDLNERQISYLHRIEYPIRNMLSMINELMVLYAQRRDKRVVVHKIADISPLIKRVQHTFQAEAEKRGLQFEVIIPAALPGVECDEEMIEQMLENLISNAIKYTPAGGRVKMRCGPDKGQWLRIEVSDTGIGIPESDLSRVFNEFYRSQNAREMEKVGTGLGLSIVKEIVNRHEGKISLTSEEGHGSTFTVHFPIASREDGEKDMSGEVAAMRPIIDEITIRGWLEAATGVKIGTVREVLAKAREGRGLELDDVAVLLSCNDPAFLEEISRSAREVKESIFGKRLTVFAQIHLSNYCKESCRHCVFSSNGASNSLSQEEIAEEVRLLQSFGHRRVLLAAGEAYSQEPDYLLKSIETAYSARGERGEIRRVNADIAPLTVEQFRRLKASKIGMYNVFQETYHQATYRALHGENSFEQYERKLHSLSCAFEAGVADAGINLLFGLYDYRFEVLALLQHVRYLEEQHGFGPHTLNLFRLQPCNGSPDSEGPPYLISDSILMKIVAILRLAVPYTGIAINAWETPEMKTKTAAAGVSQIGFGNAAARDNSSMHDSTASAQQKARNLDEAILPFIKKDYIPSFCTACYRLGRTGSDFVNLAKTGSIKEYCLPNAILSFQEYLEDFAGPDMKKVAATLISGQLAEIASPNARTEIQKRLARIDQGERDLYF
jgi:2-iminoacetate synthase